MLVGAALLACGLARVETASAEQLWSDGEASVRLDTTVQSPACGVWLTSAKAGRQSEQRRRRSEFLIRCRLQPDRRVLGTGRRLRRRGHPPERAAWYDPVYRSRNANDSPATFNPASVSHDRFTKAVRAWKD